MLKNTTIFLGMAGVGKSAIGRDVAKALNMPFFDTDKVISKEFNQPLHTVIKQIGAPDFLKKEAETVLNLASTPCVISPGGSFIYAESTIALLKKSTILIYLYDTPLQIYKRIPNIESRGIIGLEGRTFEALFVERHRLYKDSAHLQFNINHYGFDETTAHIIDALLLMNTGL
jgi:shikimate kinase